MGRKLRRDVELAALRRVDSQPPGMEVELAADPAGQVRLDTAIFRIADDRVAERGHVRAELVGASGKWLQLDPGGAVAGVVEHAPAGPGRQAMLHIDVHLFAAGARLFRERRVDLTLVGGRNADDQRPVDFARGPSGESLGEMPGGPRGPGDEQSARRVLVEAMNELGQYALVGQPVEQPIEMSGRLGPALGRQARRLVEYERRRILVDHHVANERDLVVGQPLAPRLRPRRPRRRRVGRRHPDLLPGFDAVARNRLLAVEPQLPGARPARYQVEADVGQVALEPAVEADAVVVVADGEGARLGHSGAPIILPVAKRWGAVEGPLHHRIFATLAARIANNRTPAAAACGSALPPSAPPTGRCSRASSPRRPTSPDRAGRPTGARPTPRARARRAPRPRRRRTTAPCTARASSAA